jgi:hypothetical protein
VERARRSQSLSVARMRHTGLVPSLVSLLYLAPLCILRMCTRKHQGRAAEAWHLDGTDFPLVAVMVSHECRVVFQTSNGQIPLAWDKLSSPHFISSSASPLGGSQRPGKWSLGCGSHLLLH